LTNRGLIPLERNFRRKCGELDLIFEDHNVIVFVEVRYRASERWGGGLASVTPKKQRRLINAASAWLKQNPGHSDRPCRFDVVSVSGSAASPTLNWVRSAFGSG
jgi:putative endonuclease